DFKQVPPGITLQLTSRTMLNEKKWHPVALRENFMVGEGEVVELAIDAPERTPPEALAIPQPPPCVKSGPPVVGIVLLPGGEPASGAQVALVVPREFLTLNKLAL